MFYIFYQYLLYPVLKFSFYLLSFVNKKINLGWSMRREADLQKLPKNTKPIWIHAASGEFEYAKPVIKRIKEKWPDQKILVTYFSPSYKKSVESFAGVDFSCPLPWDEEGAMQEFLEYHQPKLLLISRTDAWPQMLIQAKKMKIPSLMFSATLTPQSSRSRGFQRYFSRWVLNHLTEIHCVSQEDRSCFVKLGVNVPIFVKGDTRFDQVLDRLQNPKKIKDYIFSKDFEYFVAGSTWPEDEEILISGLQKVLNQNKLKLILVPHEVTSQHLKQIEEKLLNHNLKFCRYSEFTKWLDEQVLIVDQIGILAELYAFSDLAFVGGSFRKTVHSVMEPLAARCICLVGPKIQNNREALFFKNFSLNGKVHAVSVINNSDEMQLFVQNFLKFKMQFPNDLQQLKFKLSEEVLSKTGFAINSVDTFVENHLQLVSQ